MGNVVQKARDFGASVKKKVLEPLFGAQTGKLSDFTSTVASKTVGGSENLGDAFNKAIIGGKALSGLDYAKDSAVTAIGDLGMKGAHMANKIPIIGSAIAKELESGIAPLQMQVANIPTSVGTIEATPEFQEAKGELEKKVEEAKGELKKKAEEAKGKLIAGIKGMVM